MFNFFKTLMTHFPTYTYTCFLLGSLVLYVNGYFKDFFEPHISKHKVKYWLKITKITDYQLNMD